MATTDDELKAEVQAFCAAAAVLDDADEDDDGNSDLDAVIERAKTHIRTKKDITEDGFDWYADQYREDALFWFTCLFSKVAIGELDGEQVQIGEIDMGSLLANADGETTEWARNAQSALMTLDTGGDYPFGVGATTVTRDNRTYGGDSTGTGTGSGGGNLQDQL